MKKMTEHQIVSILKEAEAGIPVKELCRKYAIGNSTNNSVVNTIIKTIVVYVVCKS